MQLTHLPLLGLVALALAAPAPTSPNKDVANPDHVLYLITNNDDNNNALSVRQEDRCDWESYCLPEYRKCVKSCNSLKNSDCFSVVTSPSCQGCRPTLNGC